MFLIQHHHGVPRLLANPSAARSGREDTFKSLVLIGLAACSRFQHCHGIVRPSASCSARSGREDTFKNLVSIRLAAVSGLGLSFESLGLSDAHTAAPDRVTAPLPASYPSFSRWLRLCWALALAPGSGPTWRQGNLKYQSGPHAGPGGARALVIATIPKPYPIHQVTK